MKTSPQTKRVELKIPIYLYDEIIKSIPKEIIEKRKHNKEILELLKLGISKKDAIKKQDIDAVTKMIAGIEKSLNQKSKISQADMDQFFNQNLVIINLLRGLYVHS